MRVGVLALQGAFAEHRRKVENLGAQSFEIRGKKDLDRQMDGVILPGGESSGVEWGKSKGAAFV